MSEKKERLVEGEVDGGDENGGDFAFHGREDGDGFDDDYPDHADTDALLAAEEGASEDNATLPENGGSDTRDAPTRTTAGSVWSFAYYQSFFDIDTAEVTKRIKLGALPTPKFLEETKSKSDLYGPFWISTTLIFALALTGNLAHYVATPEDERVGWQYDFSKVTLAATAIYGYITLVPLGLWLGMRFYSSLAVSAFDLLCLYGYSLTVYILAACLCGLPFVDNGFQWGIIMTVMGTSSAVIVVNLAKLLHEAPAQIRSVVLAIAVLCNAALAVGFKLYFFHY